MSFAAAQQRWEQSWVYGPPENPLDSFFDEIEEWPMAQLVTELSSIISTIRCPEPHDKLPVLREMADMLRAEIDSRVDEESE